MKTPSIGWKKKEIIEKQKRSLELQDTHEGENMCNVETLDGVSDCVEEEAALQILHDFSNSDLEYDPDNTLPYDFEELINEMNETQHNILGISEARDISSLLKQQNYTKWKIVTPEQIINQLLKNPKRFLKAELLDVAKYFNLKLIGTEHELKVKNVTKSLLLEQIGRLLGSDLEITQNRKQNRIYNPKSLRDLATSELTRASYPKRVLTISYASYLWPRKVKEWLAKGKVAERIIIYGEAEEGNMLFEPYYIPDFDDNLKDFRIFAYDKTHLGTNLRKALCLDKAQGVSIKAWRAISLERPEVLHPSIIEVNDGKILDQMKETLARTVLNQEVKEEMNIRGFINETKFCRLIREGVYEADDMPGISAYERCKRRLALIEWLDRDVDFSNFPPFGNTILGMSHILYEGLRTSQEEKIYLYALAYAGTYCVRAPNTLCSESFFGSMQETDPWGQGILSASGVQKHLADFTTITTMKMDESRNVYIKTKSDTAYPNPTVDFPFGETTETNNIRRLCQCRQNNYIQCIVPKNHSFDTPARTRRHKKEQTYKPGSDLLRGERPIRQQYGYTINESRMLPSKRLGIDSKINV